MDICRVVFGKGGEVKGYRDKGLSGGGARFWVCAGMGKSRVE